MQIFAAKKKELLPRSIAQSVFGLIGQELRLVEDEFERQVRSNIQVINYLGKYLQASGGKRVRPALLILANYAVGGSGDREDVIRLATVMEMLHTATLVHDDIIDNANLRRNRASVNARFGNQTAVLMGDWLYMSAFETSLRERSLEILDILTRLTRKMTEGELIQLTMIGRLDMSEDDYFDILKRKTAYLFSACGEIGAIIAGAAFGQQTAMKDFGMNLGIAFQLADDILDLTSDAERLGKAAGSDLLEGKVTLPLIYLQRADPSMQTRLERVMLSGQYDELPRAEIRQKLEYYGAIDEIRAKANSYAATAIKSLDVLRKSEYRDALEDIAAFVIDRQT
jgi:octaprenyl-diphosphate synthase